MCKHTDSWFSQESIINPFVLVNDFLWQSDILKVKKKKKIDAILPGNWCLFSEDLEATMDAEDISLLNTACITKYNKNHYRKDWKLTRRGVFDETDGKEIVKKKLPLIYHYDG